MKKDDLITLKIEDLSSEGLGVGKCDGIKYFVKDTVIGDVAEAKVMKMKKTYGYARLMRLIEASPDRVEPLCPVARQCGGCQIQAMRYQAQLAFKEKKVRDNLQRIGKIENPPMEPIIGMEPGGEMPAGVELAAGTKSTAGTESVVGVESTVGMESAAGTKSTAGMESTVGVELAAGTKSTAGTGMPLRYRNKAQFPVGRDRSGRLIAGFYAGRTHSIIECRDCLLGAEVNAQILDVVLGHMERHGIEPYDEATGSGLVRHVMTRIGFRSGQIMVCIVVNGRRLPHSGELCEALAAIPGMTSITLNSNVERTNVILGKELSVLWGKEYIEDLIGDVRFRISPLSFYQVNPRQTQKLYEKALEYAGLTGQETVWDLYCGIGTISLFLARRARQVYGVEIVPEAIRDARQNAELNGITNAEFYVGRAEDVLPQKYAEEINKCAGETRKCAEETQKSTGGGIRADVIVVDPPRKGCEESVLETMVKMQPQRIVYVSCDPATLARDLKYLGERGYEVQKVCPVDMFGNSVHVETVVCLSQQKPDDVIRVGLDLDELEVTPAEAKATYGEIKAYVKEHTGLAVSSLYIAQVKQKYGIIERENYNKPKSEDARQPKCPADKEKAIVDALRHFQMINSEKMEAAQ